MLILYSHIGGGGYGQNIGYGITPKNIGEMITNMMYNAEIPYFTSWGFADPIMSMFEKWGHFSQIVWKDSKTVGCATYHCDNLENADGGSSDYTVCNYYPPGNVGGMYAFNIGLPLGHPTYVAH